MRRSQATIAFSDFMRDYIAERRKSPRDDLLSELIRAEEEGRKLTRGRARHHRHPAAQCRPRGDRPCHRQWHQGLLELGIRDGIGEAYVEETLRYDAPLHLFTRYALEDLEYAGIRLKKGEAVGLLLGAANRDPARFPDPDRFDPGRDPNPQVSFGAGIHFCIGAPLARLEMQIALPLLFERLPRLALAETPRYRNAYHFHGLESLRVTF